MRNKSPRRATPPTAYDVLKLMNNLPLADLDLFLRGLCCTREQVWEFIGRLPDAEWAGFWDEAFHAVLPPRYHDDKELLQHIEEGLLRLLKKHSEYFRRWQETLALAKESQAILGRFIRGPRKQARNKEIDRLLRGGVQSWVTIRERLKEVNPAWVTITDRRTGKVKDVGIKALKESYRLWKVNAPN
jgi:hypothetical protein